MKRGLFWLVVLLFLPGVMADIALGPEKYILPAGAILSLVIILVLIIWLVMRLIRKKKNDNK